MTYIARDSSSIQIRWTTVNITTKNERTKYVVLNKYLFHSYQMPFWDQNFKIQNIFVSNLENVLLVEVQ